MAHHDADSGEFQAKRSKADAETNKEAKSSKSERKPAVRDAVDADGTEPEPKSTEATSHSDDESKPKRKKHSKAVDVEERESSSSKVKSKSSSKHKHKKSLVITKSSEDEKAASGVLSVIDVKRAKHSDSPVAWEWQEPAIASWA